MHIRLIAKADGEFYPQEIELLNELWHFQREIQVTESDLRKNSESNLERVPTFGFKQIANS